MKKPLKLALAASFVLAALPALAQVTFYEHEGFTGRCVVLRRGNSVTTERDVQRCEATPSGPPQYWDVSYDFRGVEHRLQMSAPPGQTIAVNRQGEPRG